MHKLAIEEEEERKKTFPRKEVMPFFKGKIDSSLSLRKKDLWSARLLT